MGAAQPALPQHAVGAIAFALLLLLATALGPQLLALGDLGFLFGELGVLADGDDADAAVSGRFVAADGGGEGFLEADEGVVILVRGGEDGEGGGDVVGDAEEGGGFVRGGEVGVGFELGVVWGVGVAVCGGAAAVEGGWGRFGRVALRWGEGFAGEFELLGGVRG